MNDDEKHALAQKLIDDAINSCKLLGVIVMTHTRIIEDDMDYVAYEPATVEEPKPNLYFLSKERYDRGDY